MRLALIALCTFTLGSFTWSPPSAWACGEEAEVPGARGCTGCPVPSCEATPCIDFGSSPFMPHLGMAEGPLTSVGCFAVAKKEPGYHLLLNSLNLTFERSLSRNGIDRWTPRVPVTGLRTADFVGGGVQCPDPHFTDDSGGMVLIYNVGVDPAVVGTGGWGVARATSTDHGLTWKMDNDPVVLPTATHYPYMPSMVQHGNRLLLAYAWICKSSTTANAEIHVLESTDDGDTWSPLAIPAIGTGDCGEWDSGSANRPRLLSGPDGRVYLFYSGYPYSPTAFGGCGGPTRACAGIGVAVSGDGETWCKASEPILQVDFSGGWASWYVGKPTMIWASGQSVLRLYFEGGEGQGGQGGLAAAEANWADIAAFVPVCPVDIGGQHGLDHLAARQEATTDGMRITSTPNPTRGQTTFALDFGRVDREGQVRVALYDVGGRAVRELWTGIAASAPRTLAWDGRAGDGSRVVAGRYLLRVSRGSETLGSHWVTSIR